MIEVPEEHFLWYLYREDTSCNRLHLFRFDDDTDTHAWYCSLHLQVFGTNERMLHSGLSCLYGSIATLLRALPQFTFCYYLAMAFFLILLGWCTLSSTIFWSWLTWWKCKLNRKGPPEQSGEFSVKSSYNVSVHVDFTLKLRIKLRFSWCNMALSFSVWEL